MKRRQLELGSAVVVGLGLVVGGVVHVATADAKAGAEPAAGDRGCCSRHRGGRAAVASTAVGSMSR